MKRLPVVLMLLCGTGSFAGSAPAQVLKLSPGQNIGGKSQTYHFHDGSVLINTLFYQSKASGVSVGRSYVNGPLMPRETANYTDMFMVARGSGTLIESSGKAHQLVSGDFVLLPRGLTFELRDAKHYVHYFASFERQKGATFGGPIALQLLRPERFCRSKAVENAGGRHTYYQGHGGVIISAYHYPMRIQDRAALRTPDSELMFVVAGSGAIQESGGAKISLAPGAALLIPKGAAVILNATNLCTLSVRFDRSDTSDGGSR